MDIKKIKNMLIFPDTYSEGLRIINDIKFTRREIDVISFFIHGRSTKKIALFFLSLLKRSKIIHAAYWQNLIVIPEKE